MNEFSEELVKFIEETVKKAVDEHTAKIIQESVKKAVAEYALKNELDHELLVTACSTLMSFLIYNCVIDRAKIQAVMDKALEDKVAEIRAKKFGEKSEVQESEKVDEPES